jgi:cytochrome P450
MCNLLGADAAVVPRLRTSMEALGLSASMQPSILPDLERAMLVMEEYVAELIAGRLKGQRLHDTPDLLDALIAARDTGGISDAELHNLLIFLFVAGYDTSKNMLTLMMHEFLTRPDLYQRCAEDFTYCTKVVEESLRFHSPANTARMTYREFEYRDVAFPKDIMLYFPNGVIGRDPKIFENPDDIDPERENANRHIAFGSGVYMCLGQHIARAQIQEGIHLIAQRLKNPKLAGPVSHRPFPGVWGLKGLPIEFTTASARAAQSLN